MAQNETTKGDRRIFFGWNNLTEFERKGVQALQQYIKDKGIDQMPPGFEWRDWVKWIQSCQYDIPKTGENLYTHISWLKRTGPAPLLTPLSLQLLQSGCFYLHGRDRFYRPCFVIDGDIMSNIARNRPEIITTEVFEEMFVFYYNYLKKVVLLPG